MGAQRRSPRLFGSFRHRALLFELEPACTRRLALVLQQVLEFQPAPSKPWLSRRLIAWAFGRDLAKLLAAITPVKPRRFRANSSSTRAASEFEERSLWEAVASLMKTISKDEWRLLEDLSAEGLLKGLPPAIAEKDIHVTHALLALSEIKVRHAHFQGRGDPMDVDDGIKLVFAGGTCLSKAYGVIPRMSEDVDLRVILAPPSRPLKAEAGSRARLRALHTAILKAFSDLDFHIPETADGSNNPDIGDQRSYFHLQLEYGVNGASAPVLRPGLKIEIVNRPPRLATNDCEFGMLFEKLSDRPSSTIVRMPCMNVSETLAEKVVSFLRRCSWYWSAGYSGNEDDVLVRHIFDVNQIMSKFADAVVEAERLFPTVVKDDVAAFRRRDVTFDNDPVNSMWSALRQLRTRPELRDRYERRLRPLVYHGEVADYDQACAGFERVAERLLRSMEIAEPA